MISVATAGVYWETNTMVTPLSDDDAYAMKVLGGGLGSPECSQATRLLVAAGDGARTNALPDERRNWASAAHAVLQSCGPT